MEKTWIIAILIFITIIFLFWRFTIDDYKKEYSEKMWKVWGVRNFYWQGAIIISGGITLLIMFFLRWVNVLTF